MFILHASQRPGTLNNNNDSSSRLDVGRLLTAADTARLVKDEYEIQQIRRANEISTLAHTRVFETIGRLTNEREIEGMFLDVCISHGAKRQAYPIIAPAGANIANLHYSRNQGPLNKGTQLVCVDAGAEWENYASDVTRTFPRQGSWPSAEARDIYKLVERVQEECIAATRVGVRMVDLQTMAQQSIIRGLLELGILKGGDMLELFMAGVATVFFMHGLGHFVGLEVHDVGTYGSPGTTSLPMNDRFRPWTVGVPFEEGMVITIEPGVYFSRLVLERVKTHPTLAKYIDFDVYERYLPVGGVRIEDDLLVTRYGYENLTTTPKGEEMLGIIRKGVWQ